MQFSYVLNVLIDVAVLLEFVTLRVPHLTDGLLKILTDSNWEAMHNLESI